MPTDQNPSLGVTLFVVVVKKHVCRNGKQKPWDVNDDCTTCLWVPAIDQDPIVLDGETNEWLLQYISNLKWGESGDEVDMDC